MKKIIDFRKSFNSNFRNNKNIMFTFIRNIKTNINKRNIVELIQLLKIVKIIGN